MSRKDPVTMHDLGPANYRSIVHEAAWKLVTNGFPSAAIEMHGAFQDLASEAFDRIATAERSGASDVATYWRTKRRDALDIAHDLESAAAIAATKLDTPQ